MLLTGGRARRRDSPSPPTSALKLGRRLLTTRRDRVEVRGPNSRPESRHRPLLDRSAPAGVEVGDRTWAGAVVVVVEAEARRPVHQLVIARTRADNRPLLIVATVTAPQDCLGPWRRSPVRIQAGPRVAVDQFVVASAQRGEGPLLHGSSPAGPQVDRRAVRCVVVVVVQAQVAGVPVDNFMGPGDAATAAGDTGAVVGAVVGCGGGGDGVAEEVQSAVARDQRPGADRR